MSEREDSPSSKKIYLVGSLTIIGFLIPWIVIAIIYTLTGAVNIDDFKTIQYIVSVSVSAAALATAFHLWSRVPKLEGQFKNLFLYTGFTFIALLIIFCYLLVDITLLWAGMNTIGDTLNNNIEQVRFDFFGIEGLTASMPAESFVTFGLILFAISFYLFPIEKYVKHQSTPWHTISMFICTAVIPILLLLVPRQFPGVEIVMSVLTTVIILLVLYNFLFLFYLYFSMGLKSPKGTPLRKASFMIGMGLLLIIITWIAGWAIRTNIAFLDLTIQMSFGAVGVVLFNYGFYLIRPE